MNKRLIPTTFIVTVTLIVGVAVGIYLGNNGVEDLSPANLSQAVLGGWE